jgi:integrase
MATVRKRAWKSAAGEVKTAWTADYFDQAGTRRLKTFKRKKEATAWLDETKHEISRGIHTPTASSPTVTKAGEDWLAQCEVDGLEASTLRQYRQHLDLHLTPFIGRVKLAEVSPATVKSLRTDLMKTGRSRSMAAKVVTSLGAILASAMEGGKVARNVVREQSRQRGSRQRRLERRHEKHIEVGVDVPSKDELRAMLGAAQGRWRPLLIAAIFTGLRASELRGLRWDDVDLEREVLHVRQRADRWNTIGSPKSDSSKREVPLAPMAVNALREWKLACPSSELSLVFPNTKGRVDSLPNMHRRGLGALQVAAGMAAAPGQPKYGLHALRHAAASLFIEQEFTPKRVQALMGHSSIQVTFDTYGHLFPSAEDDQKAMRQLQARLVG